MGGQERMNESRGKIMCKKKRVVLLDTNSAYVVTSGRSSHEQRAKCVLLPTAPLLLTQAALPGEVLRFL